MKRGAMIGCYLNWSLDDALQSVAEAGAEVIELGTWGRQVALEYSLDDLLASSRKRSELLARLDGFGLAPSSISCHGNALHPNDAIRLEQQALFGDTVRLANLLQIDTVVDFSGCPGDNPDAKYPNWVTCAWPDDYPEILAWQWNERIIPYWTETAKMLESEGVRVAIEMHPGMAVYNPRDLLRLREASGPAVGANLDPSHLFWQQIDVIGAIRYLGDAIYHVHMKDSQVRSHRTAAVGVLDTTPFRDWEQRGWLYRTVGHGHSREFWAQFLTTLKEVGYAGPLSVEHEDVLIHVEEGMRQALALMKEVAPTRPEINRWWES